MSTYRQHVEAARRAEGPEATSQKYCAMLGGMSFGSESTTDEVLEGVDLSDRWVLVTGASAGLGQETARRRRRSRRQCRARRP